MSACLGYPLVVVRDSLALVLKSWARRHRTLALWETVATAVAARARAPSDVCAIEMTKDVGQ